MVILLLQHSGPLLLKLYLFNSSAIFYKFGRWLNYFTTKLFGFCFVFVIAMRIFGVIGGCLFIMVNTFFMCEAAISTNGKL